MCLKVGPLVAVRACPKASPSPRPSWGWYCGLPAPALMPAALRCPPPPLGRLSHTGTVTHSSVGLVRPAQGLEDDRGTNEYQQPAEQGTRIDLGALLQAK